MMDAYDLDLNLLSVADCLRSPIFNVVDDYEMLNTWVLHEYLDTASTLDTYTVGAYALTTSQGSDTRSQAGTVLGMDESQDNALDTSGTDWCHGWLNESEEEEEEGAQEEEGTVLGMDNALNMLRVQTDATVDWDQNE